MKLNLNLKASNDPAAEDLLQFEHQEVSIEDLLIWCTTSGCSDLYIKEFESPYISRFGKVVKVPCVPTSKDVWMEFQEKYINNQMNNTYMVDRMLDTAIEVRIPQDNPLYGKYEDYFFRYRASFGFSENSKIGTFRMIRPEQPSFSSINYPEICREALKSAYANKTGIIFYTGATGSGKQLHKDVVIPTTCGMKRLEDITIGDIVFDKNGEQTKIIDKYSPFETNFYEFVLSDGTSIKSGGGHLWEVELLNKSKSHNHIYFTQFFTDKTVDFLKSIDNREYTLAEFKAALIKHSSFSIKQIENFIYKYFRNLLYNKNNYFYIDLNKIMATAAGRFNVADRIKRINDFISKHKRYTVSNDEAKYILKSKFIHLIRESGQEFIPNNTVFVNGKDLANAIIGWKDNIEDAITNPRPIEILSSNDIAHIGVRDNGGRLNVAIRRPEPSKYNKVDLPIKPYWLGAWLGDGSKWEPCICGTDTEIEARLKRDYPIRRVKIDMPRKDGYIPLTTWYFNSSTRNLLTKNDLRGNKHIPEIYKIASIEDKLELIAGLIDTDGSVGRSGDCSIGLINSQIIESLREICCSLGFKCSPIVEKQGGYTKADGSRQVCKTVYSFKFYPTLMIPLQVTRKRKALELKLNRVKEKKVAQQDRHKRFYIKEINKIKDTYTNYYCLAVDSPTHMFLCTESYVPTHNTTTQVAVMNDFTSPGEILDNKVIIGMEDPIEYTFRSTDSVKFNQKELGKDFISYESGIKQALREHPNVILVGECRDKPVINATIEAARTGHLVSTSFHASDVGGTIARLSFHLGNDINLIYDLIINLRLIMSQRLIPSDTGYLVDTQYMIFEDDITKRILQIVESGKNISLEIEKMFSEQDLLDRKVVKDWDY